MTITELETPSVSELLSSIGGSIGLWLGLGGELQADEARVLVEKLLLVWCQLAKDLLNAEKLVNF